ncbi:MAG: hypothetical protein WA949_19255 [Phormidesmis sp.]
MSGSLFTRLGGPFDVNVGSSNGVATVNNYFLPIDIFGIVRSEKDGHFGNIFRLTEATSHKLSIILPRVS